ncbi:MAG: HEAT repeat domain-containing protein [Leptolyngbyaceae cyanobacterium]
MGCLCQISSRESLPTLIKVLLDESKGIVIRGYAIRALGEIGDASVIPVLMKYLAPDESDFIYRESLFALGKLGLTHLEDKIISIAIRHTEPDVRKDAVKVLGKIFTQKSQQGLQEALKDPDFIVRFTSAVFLAKQKHTGSIPTLIEGLGCRSSLGFEDYTVCRDAIDALYEVSGDAYSSLEYAFKHHKDFQVRRNAKLAIDKIKGLPTQENYVERTLKEISEKYNFAELLEILNIANTDNDWQFASALREKCEAEHMSSLYEAILQSGSNSVFKYVPNLISTIQTDCRFYNYEIAYDIIP